MNCKLTISSLFSSSATYIISNNNAKPHPSSPPRKAGAEATATKKKRSRLFCSYCKKANHTVDTCRAVPGTVTILSGGGAMAPTGCTFRVATGRIEKKKKNNKKNNKKKKTNEKLADKATQEVEAMQLE